MGAAAFVHQRADGKIVERLVQALFAGCLLDVKRFAIARQSVGQPGVRGGRGHHLVAPPL